MTLEHIAVRSSFLFAGRIVEKSAQFFVLILVARSVSLEAYSAYSLAIYFTALCTILLDWGIQPYTIREVACDSSGATLFFRHGIILKFIYAAAAPLLDSGVRLL